MFLLLVLVLFLKSQVVSSQRPNIYPQALALALMQSHLTTLSPLKAHFSPLTPRITNSRVLPNLDNAIQQGKRRMDYSKMCHALTHLISHVPALHLSHHEGIPGPATSFSRYGVFSKPCMPCGAGMP